MFQPLSLTLCLLGLPSEVPAPLPPPPPQSAQGAAGTPDRALVGEGGVDDIWDRLKIDVNGRLRGESTFNQLNGQDRHRGRFRFRLSASYKLLDNLSVGGRLSTVSADHDANNPHWDWGDGEDGFGAAEVGIDRFYFDWRAFPGFNLTAGKFGDPFSRPRITSEFTWDQDISPAGLAVAWAPAKQGSIGYDLRGMVGVALEINSLNDSGSDPAFAGLQGNGYFDVGDATELQLSAGMLRWTGFDQYPVDQGNTADAGGFTIAETFLQATRSGGPLGQSRAYVHFIKNMTEATGEDTGVTLGAQLGRANAEGAFNVFANYYDLDANAIFSSIGQDDTPVAGTGIGSGMKGFILGTEYYFASNFSARLWAITSDVGADNDPVRVRLDLNFHVP